MHSEPPPRRGLPAGLLSERPPPEAIVGIDPAKVLILAGALGDAAQRAGWLHGVVAGVLSEVGHDVDVLRPLRQFTAWCEAERVLVRATAEAVLTLEAGPPPSWIADLGIHHDPDRADFRSPVAAVDAAIAAAAALASGDRDAFLGVADRFSSNAVFAAVLLDQLGTSAVAGAVSYLAALTGSGLDDERRQQQSVVADLAAALDTARRAEVTDISVGTLLDALDGDPPGELALLFVGPTVFDDAFLAEAVERLIVQPAGVVGGSPAWVAPSAVDGERLPRDSTLLVLQALGRSPTAAARVLIDTDLERLMVTTPYADGGAQLAHVLDVGTDPALGPEAPRAALAVITWIASRTELREGDLADHPDLAADTWTGLGRVGAHYIGSFRSDGHDEVVVDPVSDQLRGEISGQQADRFLAMAARRQPAADELRDALARWTAEGVARIASRPTVDLAPYTAIGDVGRRVSDAIETASFSWAATLDDRRDAERLAWVEVVNLASSVVPGKPIFGFVVAASGSFGIDQLVPAGRAELDQARRSGRHLSGAQLRLEHLALAELWAARADNHLFDGLAPPPGLVDGDRLRAVVELDDDGVAQFDRWTAQLATRDGWPLDRLAAEFGRTGTRPTG